MPELPEVETVRRGLERLVVGRRIDGVEVGRERTVRRTSARALVGTEPLGEGTGRSKKTAEQAAAQAAADELERRMAASPETS